MDTQIKQYIQAINRAIADKSYGGQPKELYEPIGYLMELGGKRMRPLLTLLSYTLNGKEAQEVIPAALSVEIFHNFTLMHDDIMDKAPLRRGNATVHEKWNEPIAILSGDVMLVKAYEQIIANCPPDKLKEVLEKFNQCAAEVCEGQQHDMNFETLGEVSIDQYLEMIRQKTAVLLAFSLELGGILGGLDKTNCDRLYEIGIQIGLGFQLMDDILDVYADQAQFGKQVGGDIISNKKTYLLLKALELAGKQEEQDLTFWLNKTDFNKEEKVEAVKAIYQQLGIKEKSEQLMQQYFDKGFEAMNKLQGDEKAKSLMKDFFNYLIKREQ